MSPHDAMIQGRTPRLRPIAMTLSPLSRNAALASDSAPVRKCSSRSPSRYRRPSQLQWSFSFGVYAGNPLFHAGAPRPSSKRCVNVEQALNSSIRTRTHQAGRMNSRVPIFLRPEGEWYRGQIVRFRRCVSILR